MARKPISYWEQRSTELMQRLEKGTENTIDSLIQAYEQATKNINKEIANIFKNYSKETGLSKETLTKMLNRKETDKHYNNLLQVINNNITNEDIKKKLLAKYNAPAYSYRISRYQALQDNIDLELKKLADIEQDITKIRYIDTIQEGYYRNIYDIQKGTVLGFNFAQIDNRTINLMLNEKWINNANFSQRIWSNSEKLGNYLKTQLTANTMSGKSIAKISRELSQYMNVGLYNATTLVRTEVNHFANESEMLAYEELDIEKYRFIATLDKVTCEHCAELDNKEFYVKDRKPGTNYPPIHPNDRCTTVAVFDDEVTEGLQRRSRDENGKSILMPQDMNYQQWKEKYVTNSSNGAIINSEHKKTIKSANTINLQQKRNKIPNNLKEFYNYISKNGKLENLTTFVRNENGIVRGQELNKILGYDKTPTIVSNEKFEQLAKKSNIGKLYRGVSADTKELGKKYVNDFKYGQLYAGKGVYGNGTYVAYGEEGLKVVKANYTNEKGNIMTMLLDNDAKTINFVELDKMRRKEIEVLGNSISEKFKNAILMDNGYYASIKGYDAIILDKTIAELNSQPYIVILNRGKVIMSE